MQLAKKVNTCPTLTLDRSLGERQLVVVRAESLRQEA